MLQQIHIGYIEKKTDYDILNWSEYSMEVINRHNSDGKVIIVNIENKDHKQIIERLNNL